MQYRSTRNLLRNAYNHTQTVYVDPLFHALFSATFLQRNELVCSNRCIALVRIDGPIFTQLILGLRFPLSFGAIFVHNWIILRLAQMLEKYYTNKVIFRCTQLYCKNNCWNSWNDPRPHSSTNESLLLRFQICQLVTACCALVYST